MPAFVTFLKPMQAQQNGPNEICLSKQPAETTAQWSHLWSPFLPGLCTSRPLVLSFAFSSDGMLALYCANVAHWNHLSQNLLPSMVLSL